MRIVLVTGKGGVGKTTVAASTALASADAGHRTLVTSTDPAHSLADALTMSLGSDPSRVVEHLDGQQIDTQHQLDKYWGSIRRQLIDVLDWGGAAGRPMRTGAAQRGRQGDIAGGRFRYQ